MAADRASRTKALWSGAATVVVLAVVLIALGLFGPFGSKKPSTQSPVVTSPPVTASQTLYQQALQAQSSGDMTRTAELAQAALDADPSNADAKALLAAVKRPVPIATITTPGGSGTSDSGPRSRRGVSHEVRGPRVLAPNGPSGHHSRLPRAVR